MKAEWRSAGITCGALCVMTLGEVLMPPWCADNWDFSLKVRRVVCLTIYTTASFWICFYANRCSGL